MNSNEKAFTKMKIAAEYSHPWTAERRRKNVYTESGRGQINTLGGCTQYFTRQDGEGNLSGIGVFINYIAATHSCYFKPY